MPQAWIVPAIIAATAGTVGASVYSSAKTATATKKANDASIAAQDAIVKKQEANVKAAEEKAKGAETLAKSQAADKVKKKRLAQTKTVLTSPLGLGDDANIKRTTLLGG